MNGWQMPAAIGEVAFPKAGDAEMTPDAKAA